MEKDKYRLSLPSLLYVDDTLELCLLAYSMKRQDKNGSYNQSTLHHSLALLDNLVHINLDHLLELVEGHE